MNPAAVQLWDEIADFVLDRLPGDYSAAPLVNRENDLPYIAIIRPAQKQAHLILVKTPEEKLTDRESEFANRWLFDAKGGWCCARSISDAEAALIHWGIL